MRARIIIPVLLIAFAGCDDKVIDTDTASLPVVKTLTVGPIDSTFTSVVTGSVESNGRAPLIASGICWSTQPGPTTNTLFQTIIGGDTTTIEGIIPNLDKGDIFYVRAYATNRVGTAYGDELTITVPDNPGVSCSPLEDGNVWIYSLYYTDTGHSYETGFQINEVAGKQTIDGEVFTVIKITMFIDKRTDYTGESSESIRHSVYNPALIQVKSTLRRVNKKSGIFYYLEPYQEKSISTADLAAASPTSEVVLGTATTTKTFTNLLAPSRFTMVLADGIGPVSEELSSGNPGDYRLTLIGYKNSTGKHGDTSLID
jgi:hypothetical protein